MEDEMNKVIEDMTKEMTNICGDDSKPIQINIPDKLTPADYMAIVSIKRLTNPFKMVGIDYVMKDLGIGRSSVYKLFQREDFPSVSIGKNHLVMLLSYFMWKITKRV